MIQSKMLHVVLLQNRALVMFLQELCIHMSKMYDVRKVQVLLSRQNITDNISKPGM